MHHKACCARHYFAPCVLLVYMICWYLKVECYSTSFMPSPLCRERKGSGQACIVPTSLRNTIIEISMGIAVQPRSSEPRLSEPQLSELRAEQIKVQISCTILICACAVECKGSHCSLCSCERQLGVLK